MLEKIASPVLQVTYPLAWARDCKHRWGSFQTKYLFIVYADFDSSSLVRSGRFMRLKQILKFFFYFSLYMSFAKYTENCHWHIEGVDVAANLNACV